MLCKNLKEIGQLSVLHIFRRLPKFHDFYRQALFRWDSKIIAWADFLQALKGDIVHLPTPKNVCPRDIELKADIPFFATSDAPIMLIKGGSIVGLIRT